MVADEVAQRVVGDRPLLRGQPVLLELFRNQVALRDLDLLVLGVARNADDLHPVHQRLRHVQRIGRGHEHHVREVVVHLEVMVVEVAVLLGVQNLQQRGGRIAPPIGAELVHLVEQEQRVRLPGLLHALDYLARHGADICPAVTANFGLVAHAAQAHAGELAAGRARDRLAERRLAHARRADEAQDRALELLVPGLHGQILEDPLLYLLQTVVVGVQDLLGLLDVALDARALLPRNAQQPIEIVAHDGGLGRHRAHVAQLLQLRLSLLARFLAQLGLADLLLELRQFVLAVLALAELLLNGFHLLIQVVLALGLLHLPLDAVADALLHLEDADLALHEAVDLFQPLGDGRQLEQLLLVADLERQVLRDGVRELRSLLDLVDRDQDLRRHLLVELDVLLELTDHRAAEGLELGLVLLRIDDRLGLGLEEFLGVRVARDPRALGALDQHLHGPVRQLEKLEDGRDRADLVDIVHAGIVVARVLLRREQDLLVVAHHVLERAHRFVAPDEQRDDHMRKDDDIAQRQDRIEARRGRGDALVGILVARISGGRLAHIRILQLLRRASCGRRRRLQKRVWPWTGVFKMAAPGFARAARMPDVDRGNGPCRPRGTPTHGGRRRARRPKGRRTLRKRSIRVRRAAPNRCREAPRALQPPRD